MNKEGIYKVLLENVQADDILLDEPMKKHTSFKIGGPADFFITPRNKQSLCHTIRVLNENNINTYIMGNGSNLLVSDKGFRGAVIQLYKNYDQVAVNGEYIVAQAGVLLSKLANLVYQNALTGFEFASGIPGTLGGAIFMNAGAYGGEMKDVIESAEVITKNGELLNLSKEELALSYRHSSLQENAYIAMSGKLKLEKGNMTEIKKTMDSLNERRREKQPLNYPSAGSTFKRPTGYYAGKLIMDAGLKGFAINDAQVSEKHCGFVINKGNASCEDVLRLIAHIRAVVKQKFDVELEPEVKLIGEMRH
jgi:UDP-N-acetylmuramate dehydrogenase